MKNELLKDKIFRSIGEVIAAVALAVDCYINRRPHMNVGMMTPAEAFESTGDRDMNGRATGIWQYKTVYNPYFCAIFTKNYLFEDYETI